MPLAIEKIIKKIHSTTLHFNCSKIFKFQIAVTKMKITEVHMLSKSTASSIMGSVHDLLDSYQFGEKI